MATRFFAQEEMEQQIERPKTRPPCQPSATRDSMASETQPSASYRHTYI